MLARKIAISAALAAGVLGGAALPMPSMAAAVVITTDRAPPAPREERMPEPRHGYVWAPGYWDWKGHRHVWMQGHWVRERHGYAYVNPRWAERDGHWVLERGRWDRDGDSIPNNRDRHPDDPRRG